MSDITSRLRELAHAVADQRWSEFSMRVPADFERDADLVLMRAADEIAQLRAENARLIAAAPELAEALGALIDAADTSDDCQYGTLATWFVRNICSAALAKAGVG